MRRFLILLLLAAPISAGVNFSGSTTEYYLYEDTNSPGSGPGLCDATNYCFDKDDDWAVCALSRIENTTGNDRTFVAKWETASGDRQMLFRVDSGIAPEQIEVYMDNSNRIRTARAIELDTWYAVCLTNDGATQDLTTWAYDLSDSPPSLAVTDTSTSLDDGSPQTPPVTVGLNDEDGGGLNPMDGDITHVLYLSREISQQDALNFATCPRRVRAQYSADAKWYLPMLVSGAAGGADWGGRGLNFTLGGTPTTGDNPPVCP